MARKSEDKIPKVEFPIIDLSVLQSPAYGGTIMNSDQGKMIIRQAAEEDARQIAEARKFYEKMGGTVYKTGTHRWGNREYDMVSYLYQLDEVPWNRP